MVTVYVLQGKVTGKRYVGITNNLARRLHEHQGGYTKGGQVIGEFEVMHTEQFPDYASARVREKFLKSGQGREWLNTQWPRSWPATGG
jgi:putative endonuclease